MTPSPVKQQLAHSSAARTALWFAILTVPAAVAAYFRIFSGFSGWDDEGSMMMTVKQYLAGAKLYEEILSGYGPVYYFYNWLIRSATGLAVDHNTVRIVSAAVVLVCSLACAWMVLRLTQSLAAASVTHILVFRALVFFGKEPGHPQELCMLLLLGLGASGFLAARPQTRWLATATAGSLAAALTLVKINIGIFAILAVALVVLFQAPESWFSRLAKYAAAAAALLLPFALMRVHLNDSATQSYCLVVTASMAALLAGLLGAARPGFAFPARVLGGGGRFRRHFHLCSGRARGARRADVACPHDARTQARQPERESGRLVSRHCVGTDLDCVGVDRARRRPVFGSRHPAWESGPACPAQAFSISIRRRGPADCAHRASST